MKGKILHLMEVEKFLPPFIDFIVKNFDASEHRFVFTCEEKYEYGLTKDHPIEFIDPKRQPIAFSLAMNSAKKIIIHGLWVTRVLRLIYFQPWLLKKCYWVMWGGDFYFPETQKKMKKEIIRKMGHAVTYLNGDYELAKEWYGTNAKYHECFMYLSNLYKPLDIPEVKTDTINVLVGNSAVKTNNHKELYELLIKFKDENVKFYTPLSYGGTRPYALEMAELGKQMFGEKFIPMLDFMPFDKYLEFLSEINTVAFFHDRQQAMGVTISLLGLGKKVFMKKGTSSWQLFEELGVKVFDISEFNLEPILDEDKKNNTKIIEEFFSEKNYIKQLEKLFND